MTAQAESTLKALRLELWRLLQAIASIAAALLVLVVILRFVPFSPGLATLASYVVVGGALAVALFFAARWNRPLLGWVASWAVVPGYLYLVDLVVPSEPHALNGLAYVFGTAYGVIAGAVGAFAGFAIARSRRHDT